MLVPIYIMNIVMSPIKLFFIHNSHGETPAVRHDRITAVPCLE